MLNKVAKYGENLFSKKMIGTTLDYQKKYGLQVGEAGHETHNNESDAFKHAYMQWFLSNYGGTLIAKFIGDNHEKRSNGNAQELKERNMDLWNNSIGREISKSINRTKYPLASHNTLQEMVAKKIVEKIRNGELITNPDDKRKFENMELEKLTEADRVHYKGEFSNFQKPVNDDDMERYLEQAIDNSWILPNRDDLEKQVKSGKLIYVKEYTKADGTQISGYYRRKPVK